MSAWIDISRPVDATLPTWPGRSRPQHRWDKCLAAGDHCNVSSWQLSAHAGTHMDAPLHFVEGGKSIDQIPPEVFFGPCQVVDLEALQRSTLEESLATHYVGVNRLLIKTLHSRPQSGDHYEAHAALMTEPAAALLLGAGLVLVGTDRLSVDDPRDDDFCLHRLLLGAGCVIVEGLLLSAVATGAFYLSAAPLRLTDTEASPLRAFLTKDHGAERRN